MKHIIVLLAEGFEEVEAITIIDLLRRAGIKVTTIALESIKVTGAHGITLYADTVLSNTPHQFDGIVLPGGNPGTSRLEASETVCLLLKKAHNDGIICAAICAAPSVLAKAGILRNIRATCYPGVEEKLKDARFIDTAVVRDGTIITGRSVGSAIPFTLELITMVIDQKTSDDVRAKIVY